MPKSLRATFRACRRFLSATIMERTSAFVRLGSFSLSISCAVAGRVGTGEPSSPLLNAGDDGVDVSAAVSCRTADAASTTTSMNSSLESGLLRFGYCTHARWNRNSAVTGNLLSSLLSVATTESAGRARTCSRKLLWICVLRLSIFAAAEMSLSIADTLKRALRRTRPAETTSGLCFGLLISGVRAY